MTFTPQRGEILLLMPFLPYSILCATPPLHSTGLRKFTQYLRDRLRKHHRLSPYQLPL